MSFVRLYGILESFDHLSCKESACRRGRWRKYGFDPWVRNSPWRRKLQPSPDFCSDKSMKRGVWQDIVYKVAKSQIWLSSYMHNILGKILMVEKILQRILILHKKVYRFLIIAYFIILSNSFGTVAYKKQLDQSTVWN